MQAWKDSHREPKDQGQAGCRGDKEAHVQPCGKGGMSAMRPVSYQEPTIL